MAGLMLLSTIAGAVALLLWGTHMVQSGVQRAFGPHLRTVLSKTLDRPVQALAAGLGITLVLQSSTATALMAANFASAGLVGLEPAMAVMLGANVGTAIIVTLLSFNVAVLSAPLIALGLILFRLDKSSLWHDLGRVGIGLGLMLLALHQLVGALGPISDSVEALELLALLSPMPLLAIGLAALLAWVMHSSVAVVLVVVSLAAHGVVDTSTAILLVLGANLGTALNPLLEAGDQSPASRRLPVFNLANRLAGIGLTCIAMPQITALVGHAPLPLGSGIALFHLGFNLALALLSLPFLTQLGRLLRRLLPDQPEASDPSRPRYLDTNALETPMLALGGAQREALRLADTLEAMLSGARDVLVRRERKLLAETRAHDDVLDSLNTHIKRYLAQVDEDDLSEEDRSRLHRTLVFVMNMEQAGDVIDRHLLLHAAKRLKRGVLPDADSEEELLEVFDRLVVNARTAASLFMTENTSVARKLAEEKAIFRRVEQDATTRHFVLMRDGITTASQSSALHLDLLRDMKLANSFIVAAAAYPLLDQFGELLTTRLASPLD